MLEEDIVPLIVDIISNKNKQTKPFKNNIQSNNKKMRRE